MKASDFIKKISEAIAIALKKSYDAGYQKGLEDASENKINESQAAAQYAKIKKSK
jgi:hypothetical protein